MLPHLFSAVHQDVSAVHQDASTAMFRLTFLDLCLESCGLKSRKPESPCLNHLSLCTLRSKTVMFPDLSIFPQDFVLVLRESQRAGDLGLHTASQRTHEACGLHRFTNSSERPRLSSRSWGRDWGGISSGAENVGGVLERRV